MPKGVYERKSPEERFRTKVRVNENTGCHEWTAYVRKDGYANFRFDGGTGFAHRFSWVMHRGPIPDGMEIDHKCRVRHCVNPEHLQLVKEGFNSDQGAEHNRIKTHCPSGHEYSEENTSTSCGYRRCLTCMREKQATKQRTEKWRKYDRNYRRRRYNENAS